MIRFTCILGSLAALITAPFALGQTDVAGSKDYPGLTRMPGYYIAEYQESPFDSFKFTVTEAGKQVQKVVEGHRYDFRYNLTENAVMPSQLQVVRNYQNAIRAAGGQVLSTGDDDTTLRVQKDGKDVWFYVRVANRPSGLFTTVHIIEKEAMKQDVTLDARAMAQGIDESGRVALYGIYFDSGKSEIKPESAPALAEVAKLLKEKPALSVYVVGHTDMVADVTLNVKLSMARAQAVVNALVRQYGIAGTRLIPFGNGPYAPVAGNKTEEGRAKNRRVELVEIATQ